MHPCAFHRRGEEGLLCSEDMGSLKDSVCMVKEGLCAWKECECGHCGSPESAVKVRRESYSDSRSAILLPLLV